MIFQLEETVIIISTGEQVLCKMTFEAPDEKSAMDANTLHPFRLTPFILKNEKGDVIYTHNPTDLSAQNVPNNNDILTAVGRKLYYEILNSFSFTPVEYRKFFYTVLSKTDDLLKEHFRHAIDAAYMPDELKSVVWSWDIIDPVGRRRMYSKTVFQGISAVSS